MPRPKKTVRVEELLDFANDILASLSLSSPLRDKSSSFILGSSFSYFSGQYHILVSIIMFVFYNVVFMF